MNLYVLKFDKCDRITYNHDLQRHLVNKELCATFICKDTCHHNKLTDIDCNCIL